MRYLHGEGSHNIYIFGPRVGNGALGTKFMLLTGFLQEIDLGMVRPSYTGYPMNFIC